MLHRYSFPKMLNLTNGPNFAVNSIKVRLKRAKFAAFAWQGRFFQAL
jgi:hypothetical protein